MMSKDFEKPQIPQTLIDRVISETDIVETIGQHLALKKAGKEYIGLCPFHKENSPSFSVNPAKQFFYCFGCGAGGNAMNFLRRYTDRSFISIIQELAEKAGIDITPHILVSQKGAVEYKLAPAMAKAAQYFHEALGADDAQVARDYLAERKLTPEAAGRFALGYAGKSYEIVGALKSFQDELLLAGVLDQGEGRVYSSFRNRLMMPIRDVRGKVVGVSGRTLEEGVKPKYKNSKESALFSRNSVLYGLYEACAAKSVEVLDHLYVVEGQMDVIANSMIGQAACAAMGSSLSVSHLRLLLRHARHITFCFDGDHAGMKASNQVCSLLMEHLTSHEHTFDVVMLPEGEDPHSLITKEDPRFEQAIRSPINWMDAMFVHMPEAKSKDTDRGRAEYATRCVELINDARDPFIRYQAIEKAAHYTGFPISAIEKRLLAMPPVRSGQAMKRIGVPDVSSEAAVLLTRMLWDEPKLSHEIKHPTLWVEEGDALVKLLGAWVVDFRSGHFDGQYTDAEAEQIVAHPERLEEIDNKSRWRVAAASLGRRLSDSGIERLMETLMAEAPEEGGNLAAIYAWHITGHCAAKRMQTISVKAKTGAMTDQDREAFTHVMAIRRDAANRLKCMN